MALHAACWRVPAATFALAAVVSIAGARPALAQTLPRSTDAATQAEELPTGMSITPLATRGAAFHALNPGLPDRPDYTAGWPVTTALSPDGSTLLILTSGYNVIHGPDGREVADDSGEYVFIFDVSGGEPRQLQALKVRRAFCGLAWAPDGNAFYVSGGEDDTIHTYAKSGDMWAESGAPIALGHAAGLGLNLKPAVAGLAVSADGARVIAANYENDSISVVDIASRKKITELDLRPGKEDPAKTGVPGGEYPYWVVFGAKGQVYVSSLRDREIDVADVSTDMPSVVERIKVRGNPNRMTLNRRGTLLYVALDNTDTIGVIDTTRNRLAGEIPATAPKSVFPNPSGFHGSNPNSLALSPDERTLYVTDGGINAIAVIALEGEDGGREGSVRGLIPTGWYPNSVSVNRDATRLYVVNGKSMPGPNPGACRDVAALATRSNSACSAKNQYILQLMRGGFMTLPAPDAPELSRVTRIVAQNNHFTAGATIRRDPLTADSLHGKIHHIIYIVKENRTYDQVFGDLEVGNGDPHLTALGAKITPNHHQVAREFVTLDNFMASGEVSGNGWNWSTAARTTDALEKSLPVNYAAHGFSYDYEGMDRNVNEGPATLADRRAANPRTPDDPDLLPGTADVAAPDAPGDEAGAGYLWDAALHANLTVRNYGFFLDLERYDVAKGDPAAIPLERDPHAKRLVVAFPVKPELMGITDPYFRGFDQRFPDYWRFKDWEREFDQYVADKNLPALELIRLAHDHFGNFGDAIDGVNTVETMMADNDYALGLILEKVAHSPYARDTQIYVVEDDAQNGPDHVDAHRTVALVAGAYVKQEQVVSDRYSTVNMMRTIEDMLGLEPLGLNDSVSPPMSAALSRNYVSWDFKAIVPDVLRTTQLPMPAGPSGSAQATKQPRHDAAWWEEKSKGLDFSVEDNLDVDRFNRILWEGLMGEGVPYPTERSGRDLRRNREELLREFARERSSGAQR